MARRSSLITDRKFELEIEPNSVKHEALYFGAVTIRNLFFPGWKDDCKIRFFDDHSSLIFSEVWMPPSFYEGREVLWPLGSSCRLRIEFLSGDQRIEKSVRQIILHVMVGEY
jgi:hypothetical protein